MTRRLPVLGVALFGAALLACGKFGKKSESGAASASAATSAAPVVAESSAVCQVESRKTWGAPVNRLAGLTSTRADGRVLVGLALGNQPHVLAIEGSGQGQLLKLGVPADSPLAKDIPSAQGERKLQRVSPALDNAARVHGFADYADKHKSGRRRIACGAVGARDPFMVYDGKPLIDETKAPEAKEPAPGAPPPSAPPPPSSVPAPAPPASVPAAAATPSASAAAPPSAAPSSSPIGIMLRRAPLRVAGAAPPSKPPAPPVRVTPGVQLADKRVKRELRDCRTIVDPGGQRSWGVGSELEGTPRDGGPISWKMRLTTIAGAGSAPNVIHEAKLADEPGTLHTFEAPVADRLADGSYVLAMRYRGSLMVFTLSSALRRLSGPRYFGGGYPTLPHFSPDGLDFLLLTSQQVPGDRYELRFARIDGQRSAVPTILAKPRIDAASGSLAEPTLARVGNQRWLAYQSGKRREAEVVIVPVDAELGSVGRSYTVTGASDPAFDSAIFALEGGRLLVLYIKHADGQLVSDVLRCDVKK